MVSIRVSTAESHRAGKEDIPPMDCSVYVKRNKLCRLVRSFVSGFLKN